MANSSHISDTESGPLVLLVDDCVDVQRLLNARLRSDSLRLVCASSGESGLTLAVERVPDVILLDIGLPNMDGFEVLRQLKAHSETMQIPVIMLSGVRSSQDKVTAFDLGAHDFVMKPFEIPELRVRIRSAVRLSTLLRMLSQRAQLDGLTGLWNRAYFDTRWTEEVAQAGRHGRALSLALLDADHFKSINDSFGHPAGDAVLQGIARLVQAESRAGDICCRYGGEEFAVILPETSPENAGRLFERVRQQLEQVVWSQHPERPVTMSIGVAGTDGRASLSAADWLALADQNLYAAKRGGRNRLVATDLGAEVCQLRKVG